MDNRILSLISCLGGYMTAAQNQDLTDIGNELATSEEARKKAEEALIPKQLRQGAVPWADKLAKTESSAEYWYRAGCNEEKVATAEIYFANARNHWKNAAYAMAEQVHQLEVAEAELAKLREQKPVGNFVFNELNGYWSQVDKDWALRGNGTPLYTAPVPPADVAELNEEITALRMGWAECGEQKKELELKLAEQSKRIIPCKSCNCLTDC